MTWTPNQYNHKYNKYGVAPKEQRTADDIVFASKAEMHRYLDLKLLQRGKAIRNLQLQPEFVLQPAFEMDGKKYQAIKYIADFQYWDIKEKKLIIEDVKGLETDVFRLKYRMFKYHFPNFELRLI